MTSAKRDAPSTLPARIARGDPAAEREFIEQFRPGLQVLLRRRVKDPAAVEDICQETLRIALASMRDGRLRDPNNAAGYLWGIASHLANRARRHERRELPVDVGDRVDESPTVDAVLIAAERAERLRGALVGLSARDREVLTRFYLREQAKDAICRALGLSAAQFDLVKHRALKRLAAVWAAGEDRS